MAKPFIKECIVIKEQDVDRDASVSSPDAWQWQRFKEFLDRVVPMKLRQSFDVWFNTFSPSDIAEHLLNLATGGRVDRVRSYVPVVHVGRELLLRQFRRFQSFGATEYSAVKMSESGAEFRKSYRMIST